MRKLALQLQQISRRPPPTLMDRPQRLGLLPTARWWIHHTFVGHRTWGVLVPVVITAVVLQVAPTLPWWGVWLSATGVYGLGLGVCERLIRRAIRRRHRALTAQS